MNNFRRDEEACGKEIENVQEYADRVLGIEVDHQGFRVQVARIIENRIDDFIYQRFRDWPIRDLMLLEQQLQKRIKARQEQEPRRGRPPKKKSEEPQVLETDDSV